MKLLALDTATEACSVALLCDGEVREAFEIAPQQHNRLLFEMCEALFAKAEISAAQLDALAFGCGPGAFTGVRVAAAAAQGIAYAHDLPLAAVSELAAIAQQLFDDGDEQRAVAVIDARMQEVYYGLFLRTASGLAEAEGDEGIASPRDLTHLDTFTGAAGGSGLAAYPALAAHAVPRRPELLPRASAVLKLAVPKIKSGDTLLPEQALPTYLRNRVV